MVVNGNIVSYLAKNAGSIQLVVAGRRDWGDVHTHRTDRP